MQRRQLLKNLVALGSGSLLINAPLHLLANTQQSEPAVVNFKALFNQALANNPNLIGFANTVSNLNYQKLSIEGNVPKDIQGQFFRNGPAKHERAGTRYQHLFEGDGMLQRFTIGNGNITHNGKFIATPKFQKEQQAQRFIYSGPDTEIVDSPAVSSPDIINTANTNVIAVGDELWALWEAGSATSINKHTLEYQGQVTLGEGGRYGNTLKGLPFSAHPKIAPNGDIWNFGLSPSGQVIAYHLSASGMVKHVGLINANYRGGMLHDFLVTDKHLLIILPSLKRASAAANNPHGFFATTVFDKEQAMRVLVVRKSDFSIRKQYELPPAFAFHYGNAWEDNDGTIRFDASLYPDVNTLHNLSNIMMGQQSQSMTNSQTALFTLNPNGTSERVMLGYNSEFPRVCEHLVGIKNNFLYQVSSKKNMLWSDSICSLNIDSGNRDSYYFGSEYLVEEHIAICPQKKEGSGYLIGTALHVPSKRSCVNIFKANAIADGPLVRAWLPYHLPLGFHGNFIPT